MRIEKRGDTECLVGAPAEETGCGALWYDWLQCRHHLDGEHVGISSVRPDGSVHVLKRWPIEPGAAPVAPPRSAEEIAREMVPDAGWLQLGTDGVRLASDVSVPHARSIIARAITKARADGAAAALHGQQPRDLAGRIRALVQQKAGEMVDADVEDDATRGATSDVMRWLLAATLEARSGEDVSAWVNKLREVVGKVRQPGALVFAKAADELEAIISDCATEAR